MVIFGISGEHMLRFSKHQISQNKIHSCGLKSLNSHTLVWKNVATLSLVLCSSEDEAAVRKPKWQRMSLSQKELVLVDRTVSLGRRKRISAFSWDEVTRCETRRMGRHHCHVKSTCYVKFPSKCTPLFQIASPGAQEYLWSWTANSRRAEGKQEHPAFLCLI